MGIHFFRHFLAHFSACLSALVNVAKVQCGWGGWDREQRWKEGGGSRG